MLTGFKPGRLVAAESLIVAREGAGAARESSAAFQGHPSAISAAAAAPRTRLARPAPARRQLAAPPAAGLFGGLLDTVAAANAEGLARKEAGLVGAERGLKPLPAVPAVQPLVKAEEIKIPFDSAQAQVLASCHVPVLLVR